MDDKELILKELDELRKRNSKLVNINNDLIDSIDIRKAEERINKNKDFLQLYRKELRSMRGLTTKNSTSMQILLLFAEKMNKQNAIVISMKALQQITGHSRATLSRAVKTLKDESFIKIVKIGTSNAYILNSNVFWTTHADHKEKISVFSATVIATGAEQNEKYIENWDKVKLKRIPLIQENEILTIADEQEELND